MTDDEFINSLRLRRLQKMPESEMPKIEIKNALEGWVSPVELIYEDAKTIFLEQTDEHIMARCEATLGVKVDRDELIKAMHYDREQYKKGFENGYKKRDAEIVRCKDCKHLLEIDPDNLYVCARIDIGMDGVLSALSPENDFCSRAERKETE